MTPEQQGFAVGVLCCVVGGLVLWLVSLTLDEKRTEGESAELDRQHPRSSDEEWARIRLVLDEDAENVRVLPRLRSVPDQRTPGGAS